MAAGRGTRLGADRPKALVPLGHGPGAAPLVTHALRGVLSCPDLSDVVVVAPPDRMPELTAAVELVAPGGPGAAPTGDERARGLIGQDGHTLLGRGGQQVSVSVVAGGAERTDSVAAGLAALPADVGIVLVHDAARALTPPAVFEAVVAAVRHGHPAVVPGMPVTDTIKTVDARDHVVSTPERSMLRSVQTPQGFLRETLERAHREGGGTVSDDAGLVEALGDSVFVVGGHSRALKVTAPEDLAIAGAWVQPASAPSTTAPSTTSPSTSAPSTAARREAMRPDVRDASARTAPVAPSVAWVPGEAGAGRQPVLLVLGGLPGTGKTTLARAWARARGAVHVRVDTIEQALARTGAEQVGPEGYAVAYAVAADQLALGIDVVADSVNPLPVTRQAWREAAEAAGAQVLEVELTCAATEHRERVETRTADIAGHRVPDWSAVETADYVPWPRADLRLDTTGADVSDLVAQTERALAAAREGSTQRPVT